MKVAVAYAEAKKQMVFECEVNDGATAVEAIERSGILAKFPHIDLKGSKIGVYGKIIEPDQVVHPGDRLEIYRPALGKPPKKDRAGKEGDGADADDSDAEESKAEKKTAAKQRVAAKKQKDI
ncbi:MAG: protein of unknown function UPF0125 [Magnetococcales bacterium]|nr:protein of unknown function UPF0125 [Magnetococcales bacterium]HIJ83437.1 RnfH family protein [Magnetococcales bacterium]